MLSKGRSGEAAILLFHDSLGIQSNTALLYGHSHEGAGISNVDGTTNRITFADRITKITITDTGGIDTVKRRIPFLGKPLEVGVPPAVEHPLNSVKISFKDPKGRSSTILGLKIKQP